VLSSDPCAFRACHVDHSRCFVLAISLFNLEIGVHVRISGGATEYHSTEIVKARKEGLNRSGQNILDCLDVYGVGCGAASVPPHSPRVPLSL
jgi:hypothetical protein